MNHSQLEEYQKKGFIVARKTFLDARGERLEGPFLSNPTSTRDHEMPLQSTITAPKRLKTRPYVHTAIRHFSPSLHNSLFTYTYYMCINDT